MCKKIRKNKKKCVNHIKKSRKLCVKYIKKIGKNVYFFKKYVIIYMGDVYGKKYNERIN